jgi:hypothetical protein
MIYDEEPILAFDPQSSITAYELAQLMAIMEMGVGESLLKTMPKELQRHFKGPHREA